MKFTTEQAIEKLKAYLTNDGKKPLRISDRTLKEHVENLAALVADEEMELDDFFTKVKSSFDSINANVGDDVSKAIKDYKENNPYKKPTDNKPNKPEDDGNGDKNPNKELLDRLAALEAKEAERVKGAAIADKRNSIKQYLAGENVKNEKWIEKMLDMMKIEEDSDSDALGKQLLEFYNAEYADTGLVTPRRTNPGDDSNEPDSFAAVRQQRKAKLDIK